MKLNGREIRGAGERRRRSSKFNSEHLSIMVSSIDKASRIYSRRKKSINGEKTRRRKRREESVLLAAEEDKASEENKLSKWRPGGENKAWRCTKKI